MPITINGSGTVAGLSVGGINDGAIAHADLADSTKPLFTSYAIICDQKSGGTDGGTFTSGSWQDRDLNTEIADPDGIVSINSTDKTFTLGVGTYLIEWYAPGMRCQNHQSRLYDVTAGAAGQYGRTAYADKDSDGDQTDSIGYSRVTISGSDNVYKIQHHCSVTETNIGFGVDSASDGVEIYTVVKIWKEAS